MLSAALLVWLFQCCDYYNTEPALPLAVMAMESGFKCGPLGKKGTFIGPGGLHKDFAKKWNIYNPYENIRVVVMAFRGKKDRRAIIQRLKVYNKRWWENNYIPDVLAQYNYYRRRLR